MKKQKSVTVSSTLRRLLLHCETQCTADCCKGDAFDLSKERIHQWIESERIDRIEELKNEIHDLSVAFGSDDTDIKLDVRDLESTWHSKELEELLLKIKMNITQPNGGHNSGSFAASIVTP